MRKSGNHVFTFILIFICALGCRKDDVLDEVNVMIGTGGAGRIVPVAVAPHGMVQLGPDTHRGGSGYSYEAESLLGFSHTHKSGGGCGEFLDILLQPTSGDLKLIPGDAENPDSGYRSRFSHAEEHASPGLYQVKLLDYDIDISLTATKRCGFHKYHFPYGKEAHIILDLIHGNINACTIVKEDAFDSTRVAYIHIIDDQRIEGFKISEGWNPEMHVYFAIEFSQPFISHGILDERNNIYQTDCKESSSDMVMIRAHFDFNVDEDSIVMVKAGISPVSMANAWENLKEEITGWDFWDMVSRNKSVWREELNKFRIKGGTEKQKKLFYTCLYNTLVYPMLYMDVNGEYRGPDFKVHKAYDYCHYSGYIGTWDIFRAANPLLTLIKPDVANDYVKTLIEHYKIYGLLPVWVVGGHEAFTMQGFHSVPMIVDAYYKGINDYNIHEAYDAILTTAMKDSFGLDMRRFVGLKNFKRYGYVPADIEYESVAKTLEYAYDDWTVAQMSKMLGYQKDYEYFIKRSQNYKNVFDTTVNFMRGRLKDGSWRTPFDPFFSNHRYDDFMEGNAWQWSFYVPHDPIGLSSLMGGKDKMIEKLDSLFIVKFDPKLYPKLSGDISGLIGQYAHGNEPSHHIAYLYNYLGEPWKAQKWVNEIKNTLYDTIPQGYAGNEDTGQMSAWFVFSSLGFYPVSHGEGVYVIGTPSFEKIEFKHGFGGTLKINAKNISEGNIYIQSVKLNGKKYTKNWFQHEDIFNKNNVTIEFEMGDKPNFHWGTRAENCPPSMSMH